MAQPTAEVLRRLEEHPWEETTARLLRHALNKIGRHRWRGERRGYPPAGIEAEDVVQTVYEKLRSGRRDWKFDTHPDLFLWLRDQVDSEISNLVRSAENRKTVREETLPVAVAEADRTKNFDLLANSAATPEEELLVAEDEKRNQEFFFGLLEFMDGEEDLQKVVQTIVDGIRKPADIAQHLGVRADQIYACRKRLQRRLEEYRERRAALATERGGT